MGKKIAKSMEAGFMLGAMVNIRVTKAPLRMDIAVLLVIRLV